MTVATVYVLCNGLVIVLYSSAYEQDGPCDLGSKRDGPFERRSRTTIRVLIRQALTGRTGSLSLIQSRAGSIPFRRINAGSRSRIGDSSLAR